MKLILNIHFFCIVSCATQFLGTSSTFPLLAQPFFPLLNFGVLEKLHESRKIFVEHALLFAGIMF